FFKLGDCITALELAEGLVCSSPENATAWQTLAQITRTCRMWERAFEAARQAYELDGDDYKNMFHYADLMGEFGRLKENRELLERIRVLSPSLLSLPLYLGETVGERFPYLHANTAKTDEWRARLASDKRLKVGVAWTGFDNHYRNNLRSVPVVDLVEALR